MNGVMARVLFIMVEVMNDITFERPEKAFVATCIAFIAFIAGVLMPW